MKKIILICIGLLALIPSASFAAEEKFFEFATDVGTPIEVPSGSVAIQEFKLYNDSINAVDVWFDNTGSSGSVTVALIDAASNVLATKSLTVTHADPFYTGRQLHVKFDRTIGVTSGAWYKIRVTSGSAKLRLYGVKRVQFVEHNAPYSMDTAVGSSLLDGEPQLEVFKFALYEEIDAEAPVIANASSTIAGPDEMRISFNANELVDRTLSYTAIGSGVVSTVTYSGNYSVCFEGIFSCPITINPQRNTLYTYRLTVRDSWGNESYFDGAFESWKPGTPTPPADPNLPPTTPPSDPTPSEPQSEPLSITNGRIVSVTATAVQVSWDTDRAANSTLIVSTDPVGAQVIGSSSDTTHELAHTLAIGSGLTPRGDYYATLISRDGAGVMDAEVIPFSAEDRFATTTTIIPNAPATTLLQVSVSGDRSGASIAWQAPASGEPSSGYRIDIIDANGGLFRTLRVASGTHSVDVSGLEGGEYRAIAYADNGSAVEKIAPEGAVVIPKRAEPLDTYELIKKPIFYIPAALFVAMVAGLYWYSRRQRGIIKHQDAITK